VEQGAILAAIVRRSFEVEPTRVNSASIASWIKSAHTVLVSSHRLRVAVRVVVAVVGGYQLTSISVAVLAVYLPMTALDATLTATMLAFAIYASIVLWVFAARSPWRTCLWMAAGMLLMTALLRAHAQAPFP
jgi:hypothetical protein